MKGFWVNKKKLSTKKRNKKLINKQLRTRTNRKQTTENKNKLFKKWASA